MSYSTKAGALSRVARQVASSALRLAQEEQPESEQSTGKRANVEGHAPTESNAKKADERLLLEDLRKATKVVASTLFDFLGA